MLAITIAWKNKQFGPFFPFPDSVYFELTPLVWSGPDLMGIELAHMASPHLVGV
jgi:hypothetical protein